MAQSTNRDVTVPQTINFPFGGTIMIIIGDCFCRTGPKILSKRSGKSVDEFWGSGSSPLKSNPSGSGKPIIEGVSPKMQPAEMQAVPFIY